MWIRVALEGGPDNASENLLTVGAGLGRPGTDSRHRPCASRQRPFLSARVGDTGEIHYRWHPFVGQRVPIVYTEHRSGELVAICDMPDGSRAVVQVWMLDRVACATLVNPRSAPCSDRRAS